jgi:hypothetical protein
MTLLRGKAVQVDRIKPTLKAHVIKLLKANYNKPLSNVAFKFNLRYYTEGVERSPELAMSWYGCAG